MTPVDVQRLTDLYEIQKLKARYFSFLDLQDWDNFRDLFLPTVDGASPPSI